MSLSDRLNEDMKLAMRAKDKFKLTVVRMVIASIKNLEIDQRRTLSDDEILEVVGRELKQRKDSLQEFEKADRQDLVESISREIEIISEYLPQQLTEDELRSIIEQVIREVGAATKADMGKVMGALMPKVKGIADGKVVNQLVQQLLQ